MPPKKKANEPSTKTEQKKKAKVVEDKTFGLKNKKGNRQQKFIKTVEKTVLHGDRSAKQHAKEKEEKEAKKDAKKKAEYELNSLFKPVDQKVAKGVDPKSVLCAFFKAGSCSKGDKCKFSHDLNIARKGEKKNIYDGDDNKEETMDDWDEATLEEVINKKHGESNKKKMETKIICKFFVDAVENSKYGWFWECPNGKECHYKHALPPGFVLKKDAKKVEKKDEITLEELIERERAALNSDNLTRVTLESFLKWKDRKRKEKVKAMMKNKADKKKDFKAGKVLGISGRELFEFNPDLVVDQMDDDEAGDDMDLSKFKNDSDDEDDDGGVEINLEELAAAAREVDGSAGTKRGEKPKSTEAVVNGEVPEKPAKHHDDESSKLDMASGGATSDDPGLATNAAIASATSAIADMPIDENLFDGDDIFDVELELETLDLED